MFAAALLGWTSDSWAAAAIALNNHDVNGGSGAPVMFYSMPAGEGFFAEVYGGPNGSSLEPLIGSNGSSVFGMNNGFFDGGVGVVPGVADDAVGFFQVHVWQGPDNSPTGWQSSINPVASAVFSQVTGDLGHPAPLNFPTGLVIAIPEPATWCLAVAGATLLVLPRRRTPSC